MASGPEGSEKLNYQKWVLKVSIHCEGCKKKVKKVLKGIEGIYSIDIESKQNRATVIGNVKAETLIRKLLKHGKHAELWPDDKPSNPSSSPETGGDAEAKGKEKVPATVAETEAKPANSEKSPVANEGKTATDVRTAEVLASITEVAKSSNVVAAESPKSPVANEGKTATDVRTAEVPALTTEDAKTSNDVAAENPKAGGCDEPDKVKQKDETTSEAREMEAVKEEETKKEKPLKNRGEETAKSMEQPDQSASRPQPSYPLPAYGRPAYAISYNTAYPQTIYSYYAVRPPAVRSDDVYSIHAPPAFYYPGYYPPETYYGSMELPTSRGNYDIFNEENPNACRVM